MVNLVLGSPPDELTVHLGAGPFATTLRSQDSAGTAVNWPGGATLRLELTRQGYTHSWSFVISGALATLTIPASEVALVPERTVSAHLWLNYGSGEFLWCSGSVVRRA